MSQLLNKQTLSWAFYDWANSAYSTVVLTAFFPILFGKYWFVGENTTTPLGLADGISSMVIVILAPVLGAIADRGGLRKQFLFLFLSIGVVAVSSLSFVAHGQWQLALLVYVFSYIGFAGGNVFYDSMIVAIAPKEKLDMLSALGFSIGYIGGGLALLGCVIYADPQKFGIDMVRTPDNIRLVFLFIGVWWAVFTIPLLLFVKERKPAQRIAVGAAIRQGMSQLLHTFQAVRKLKVVFSFLLAYWLYIDGVDTIIVMAADFGSRIGFGHGDLIMAFLVTQFVAFPAAILYGKLGERIGAKAAILIAIAIYIGVCIYGFFINAVRDFYVLAIVIGLVQGGIQSLSRSFYARIIPANKSAEYFGFYNMLGKLAAVLGPLLMALVSHFTHSPRLSILSLIVLFVLGATLLLKVNEAEGVQMAHDLENIN